MSKITEDTINKYKRATDFGKYYFKVRDTNGNIANLTGVIAPYERDNRDLVSPVEDLGSTPFCAAYSVCTIIEAMYWKSTGHLINLDQDHVYARAKEIDGSTDDGTYLESAITACAELLKIPEESISIKTYYNNRNQATINTIKHLVHKHDLVHAGFSITDKWYNCDNDNYIIQAGGTNLGGHAVVISGYDLTGVYITNSWGKDWGATGMAILPWTEVLKQLMYVAVFDIPELKI